MGLPYWSDGLPSFLPLKDTRGQDYWADGEPIEIYGGPPPVIYPTGIASEESFGTPIIGSIQIIKDFFYWIKAYPSSIKVVDGIPGDQRIRPEDGYYEVTLTTVGRPIIQFVGGPQYIAPEGIESEEAFGIPTINPIIGRCLSTTLCEDILPGPANCLSTTLCEDILPGPANSLSETYIENLILPAPEFCLSLTYCIAAPGSAPIFILSLTKCQDIPLSFGEGTFLIF